MNASPKRAQLTPDELRQLRWLLGGVMILLGVWTVVYMSVDAWVLTACTTLAAGAALAWPTLPARVPRIAHVLAFPCIVAFFAADFWLKQDVLDAMVRLGMLLLFYRSISYRQRRDDLQIIVLGLFLIVVAGVLTVSLAFAVQLLLFTACALAFLFVVTLTETQAPTPKPEPGGPPPAWAAHVHWPALARRLRAVADWRLIGFGALLFAGVVAGSSLLFLAIPRFQLQNSLFLDRFITKKARSGFSETVRFGQVTEIQQDNSVAFSVDVSNPQEMPAMPYWRMLVLDVYEKQTFRASVHITGRMPFERARWSLEGDMEGRRRETEWKFYLEPGVSRYLPLLGRFGRLEFAETQNFRHHRDTTLVALVADPVTMTAYRVYDFDLSPRRKDERFAERLRAPREDRARDALREHFLQDANSRALLAEARQSVAGGAELAAAAFAERASAWLRERHAYSLSPRIPDGPADALVKWLVSRESGHCELFAGAFVLLAREAGFAARVVAGFKGGSWNGYSNSFTVRNADAHAWAEIFDVESASWLRVDPLEASAGPQAGPEAQGAAAAAARTDRSWKARLDSLRVLWYRRVVSFDQQAQLQTLKSMKEATESSSRRLRAAIEEMLASAKAWVTSPWDARRVGALLAGVAGIAALGWLWRGYGRRWWRSLRAAGGKRGPDPVRSEAGHWLARLAAGQAILAHDAPVILDLQRLRFGARDTWKNPEAVFHAARRAHREQRRADRATRT